MRKFILAFSVLAFPAIAGTAEDVLQMNAVGQAAVDAGFATHYKVGYNKVDVYIGSTSDRQARVIAQALCTVSKKKYQYEINPQINVYMSNGIRPAATCKG